MKNDEPEKLDNIVINKRGPKKLEPSLKYIHLYIGIPGSKHVESHKKATQKAIIQGPHSVSPEMALIPKIGETYIHCMKNESNKRRPTKYEHCL